MMSPGEIYLADTAMGVRPVIVVSREELNRGTYVVGILCTSARYAVRSLLAHCVPFQAGEFGLIKECVAQAEAITFVAKSDLRLDRGPVGVLSDEVMRDVVRAIGYMLDADCEPA